MEALWQYSILSVFLTACYFPKGKAMNLNSQRLVWAAKQALGKAALGALFAWQRAKVIYF